MALPKPNPTLVIDEKWSIEYDPANNDRPVRWLRYGNPHEIFAENNAVTCMFYALLRHEQHHLEGG